MKYHIPYLIIIALLITFIWGDYHYTKKCNCPSQTSIITKTKIVKGDSIPYYISQKAPQLDTVIEYDTVKIFEYIDTAALLYDYLLTRKYTDTLKKDSSYLIIINNVVNKNQLASQEVLFQNLREKAIINHITMPIPEAGHQFFSGAILGSSLAGKPVFAPSLAWMNKKGRILSLQYDIVQKQVQLGIHYKLNR